jgi:hypothetical protein
VEEKPDAKDGPKDDERHTSIVDDPFLLLLLCFDFRRDRRFESDGIADIFPTLIAVIIALRHL